MLLPSLNSGVSLASETTADLRLRLSCPLGQYHSPAQLSSSPASPTRGGQPCSCGHTVQPSTETSVRRGDHECDTPRSQRRQRKRGSGTGQDSGSSRLGRAELWPRSYQWDRLRVSQPRRDPPPQKEGCWLRKPEVGGGADELGAGHRGWTSIQLLQDLSRLCPLNP